MIKYLVMDVDGTLTDGKIYMGPDGEALKAFDIKDGCGILLVLPKLGVTPVIITARRSKILENRCMELNISELHQGINSKLAKLKEVVGEDLSNVAYAGDDLPDIPCMEAVKKSGGIVLCPADAIPEIKAIADYISGYKAGDGAIRDCIQFLKQKKQGNDLKGRVQKIVELILAEDFADKKSGDYMLPDGTRYMIQEYSTKPEDECVLESHRKHIDIQYMLSGHEKFKVYSTDCLTSACEYNVEKDVDFWYRGIEVSCSILNPGGLIVIYHGQPHKGAIIWGKPEKVRKVVCKIDVNKVF